METTTAEKRRVWPYVFITVLGVILLLGTFALDGVRSYFIKKIFAHPPAYVVTISTTTAKQQPWQSYINSMGSLVAVNGVSIAPRVNGQVEKILFKSGSIVKKGQVLVQLSDSLDEQTVKTNKAVYENAKLSFARMMRLYKTSAAAKSDLDQAKSTLEQAKASLATAKLTLGYKQVKAPFAGRVGIRQVNVGQYLTPNSVVVSLQQLSPIYADFSLPEKNLKDLSVGQKIAVNVDSYPGQTFPGSIIAVSPQINVNTRTISVRAALKNDNMKLLPGQFANIKVLSPTQQQVVTIPLTAVTYSLFGDSVYVIKTSTKDGKPIKTALLKAVKLGPSEGNTIVVTHGLKAGEQVVVAGQLKLHNGSQVNVNNSVKL